MQPPFLPSGRPGLMKTGMSVSSGTKPAKYRTIFFNDEDQGKNNNFQESRLNENTSTM